MSDLRMSRRRPRMLRPLLSNTMMHNTRTTQALRPTRTPLRHTRKAREEEEEEDLTVTSSAFSLETQGLGTFFFRKSGVGTLGCVRLEVRGVFS